MNKNRTANYKWNTEHGYEKYKIVTQKISTSAQDVADWKDDSNVRDKYRSD